MSWSKVLTALRGVVSETGENIADAQALRILDQEIREADSEMHNAKVSLTELVAKRKGEERKIAEITGQIGEYENYAVQALDQENETLAAEIAERIAGLEADLASHTGLRDQFQASEANLRQNLRKAEVHLKSLKQQATMVRATESVQKAQTSVSGRFSGADSRMNSALSSLERIKQRQQERSDRFAASLEMEKESGGDDLEARLKDAGIVSQHSSGSVLERLRARRAAS